MLQNKIIDSISNTADAIVIDQSRCLRMRFNKNTCSKCIEHCRFDAVRIDEGIDISRNICSECMLCVSTCPSGCFNIKAMDFYSTIAQLKKTSNSVQFPVLGCNMRHDAQTHVNASCLGFLSEEHILALSVFMKGCLQLNLTECSDCRNGFIVDVLKERLDAAAAKSSIKVYEKIMLIEAKTDLHYQDISYDRRGFFRALKNFTIQKTAGLFDDTSENEDVSAYSDKKLPLKNDMLNRMLPAVTDEIYRDLIRNYYYNVTVNESCNNCFACVGMCPTGALKIGTKESGPELTFNSSLCSGCGLCEGFCMNNAICVEQGFSGHSPFEFYNIDDINKI
jgi:ferredoxin